MPKDVGHIKNPLTVISIFAGIAEISGTVILPFIEVQNQATYIWFLMLFPPFLVGIFFATLNWNHKALYAPSDYQNEDNFLNPIGKATKIESFVKLEDEVNELVSHSQTSDSILTTDINPLTAPSAKKELVRFYNLLNQLRIQRRHQPTKQKKANTL
ncbi:hypothetical protein M5C90_15105 [Pseudomonas chlororaphis subsp. piscium]|nr:hypothetical protein M5C90_15105 [Pseudomonas chlororaphis subsp. piscium]